MATFWRQAVVGHSSEASSDHTLDSREIEIIELARSDPRAFAPLYELYYPQVHGYCLRRLRHREAAADATAQVFTRALSSLSTFRQRGTGTSSFRGWLFTIAHNIVIDLSRRTRHHYSLDAPSGSENLEHSPWLHDSSPGPEAIALDSEARVRVRALLDRLPERQRRIVELRMSGLNGVEIADALQMSHAAVKSAQFRAYSTLREFLQTDSADSHPTSTRGRS